MEGDRPLVKFNIERSDPQPRRIPKTKPPLAQIRKKVPVNNGQFAILETEINLQPEDRKQKATVEVAFLCL